MVSRDVYCHGELLEAVQSSGIFPDSKTFVDMPMKQKHAKVLTDFKTLCHGRSESPTKQELQHFLQQHFDKEGEEFEGYSPVDWTDSPSILSTIKDTDLCQWASHLNSLWKKLGRKIKESFIADQSSLLYLPHPVVVPGDRFREIYYWDSFWIINGLLLCDMTVTAKGMIQNLISLVQRYGMVPNGGRIYYLTRSQPPFLVPMVNSYLEKTGDVSFVKDNLEYLEQEYHFWIKHRSVQICMNGKTYSMQRYKADSGTPRPEGFKEDWELSQKVAKDKTRSLLQNVASACESGWDFSTRWFKDYLHLETISTQDICPVDLNCLLAWNEKLLSKFYSLAGAEDKASEYSALFTSRCEAVEHLMWCEEDGCWYDIHVTDGQQRKEVYISNILPLYTECYDKQNTQSIVEKVLAYLQKSGLVSYEGGVPTSMCQQSSQQWDFPNSWPPCVHMFISGLQKTGVESAMTLAKRLTTDFINSSYKGWKTHSAMFEKYSVTDIGTAGGGGEYHIQTGFGWTNGAVLMLLNQFPDIRVNTSQ